MEDPLFAENPLPVAFFSPLEALLPILIILNLPVGRTPILSYDVALGGEGN